MLAPWNMSVRVWVHAKLCNEIHTHTHSDYIWREVHLLVFNTYSRITLIPVPLMFSLFGTFYAAFFPRSLNLAQRRLVHISVWFACQPWLRRHLSGGRSGTVWQLDHTNAKWKPRRTEIGKRQRQLTNAPDYSNLFIERVHRELKWFFSGLSNLIWFRN